MMESIIRIIILTGFLVALFQDINNGGDREDKPELNNA